MKGLLLAVLLVPLVESGGMAAALQSCPSTLPLLLSPTGCRGGTAVATIDPVDGATYSWTIQGGTLLSGAGTERAVIAIGSGQTLKVSLLIASASCGTQTAAGVMALHDGFALKSIEVIGGTHAGQPRTLTWSFENGEPVTQTLSGTDFPKPVVLPGAARVYTYTPSMYGDKSVFLDASIVPVAARTRAVGRGGAAASSCSSVRGVAKFHVDCNTPVARITAPAATGVGLPFTASVKLEAGTSASWTIANGAPATATGESVDIVPAGNAPVDIHVTVSADTCTASASAQVKVDSALGCAVVPQATLSLKASDCDKGVIAVRLVGTPPFSGTWSDGEPFTAVDFGVERIVTAAADYTIKNFHDAFCPGQASTLHFANKPTATLSTSGSSCLTGDATAVITFTGTPPFLGEWSDSVAFNTTAARLERKITKAGDLTLKWFQDANCDGIVSGHAAFGSPGTAAARLVSPANGCLAIGVPPNEVATVAADLTGTPPFTVRWSDGAEQTVNASPATRLFAPQRGTIAPLTLASARDAYCELQILNATVTVTATSLPILSPPDPNPVCGDRPATVTLKSQLTPTSKIAWHIENGTIVGGQGTSQVTFSIPTGQSSAKLSVEVSDPNLCTVTNSAIEVASPPAGQVKLTITPTTINLGESLSVTTTVDPAKNNFATVWLLVPYFQQFGDCWHLATCTSTFTPTTRGTYTFEAVGSAWCAFLPATYATVDVTVK